MRKALLLGLAVLACSTARQAPLESLEAAYRDRSVSHLEGFLESWHNSVPVAEMGDRTPAFDAALEIFKDVYRPRELQRLGRPEWGTDQYAQAAYAVVQETLRYQIVEDESFPGTLVGERDLAGSEEVQFCPALDLASMKRLCLTDTFRTVLQEFLGNEAVPALQESIMAPSRAAGESQARLAFLNSRLKIFRGHWGGWYYETHPRITLVRFNRSMTDAIAYFQVVHQGGEARYRYIDGSWIFQSARFTWIT